MLYLFKFNRKYNLFLTFSKNIPISIAGIDLEPGREGGTWLAIGHSAGFFKVGALLNLTGEPKPRDAVGKPHLSHLLTKLHRHIRTPPIHLAQTKTFTNATREKKQLSSFLFSF